MNHPRRGGGGNMGDPSETADDSENYIEESPFLVETRLKPASTAAHDKEGEDEGDDDDEDEPGKLQDPTLSADAPIGEGPGGIDYSLSTIYEDVDLAQLREEEAKLLEQRREAEKAAVLASTPRELSKRNKVERAQAEIDV